MLSYTSLVTPRYNKAVYNEVIETPLEIPVAINITVHAIMDIRN